MEPKSKKALGRTGKPLDNDVKKLGKRIRELRIKKGYTSYEIFAYEHNIPRAQLGRYENGEDMRFTSFLKIVRALGISMNEFFGEDFD
jgi:transcriptional regulator with XRE-family HTH domain